jgi:hypothetical protein
MKRTESVSVERVKAFTLCRLFFLGTASWMFPLSVISGIGTLCGFDSVKVNGEYIHGFKGLSLCILSGVFAPAFFTFIMTLVTWPGLWLYSKFRPMSITYIVKGASRSNG